jgi:hypothetical protein
LAVIEWVMPPITVIEGDEVETAIWLVVPLVPFRMPVAVAFPVKKLVPVTVL